ncbi:hypothetical protein ACQZP5_002520 [Enterococcus faecalis]
MKWINYGSHYSDRDYECFDIVLTRSRFTDNKENKDIAVNIIMLEFKELCF